ncbi:MAG: ABC transporter substrate-binding protein [bacterium]|nr:ABC transporter substrate-binding protein [bacterium]
MMKRSWGIAITFGATGILLSIALQWIQQSRPVPEVEDGRSPHRIICQAPSAVETVFALGEGGRVIAVSDFTYYPPEAMAKEKMGGYFNPNFERILAIKPDLLILQGESDKLREFCQANRIEMLRIDMRNLATIYHDIETIGRALGVEEKAKRLVETMKIDMDEVRAKARGFEHKPKVFISLGRKEEALANLTTCGGGVYIDELVEAAGGINLFGDLKEEYPQISLESLTRRAPDIILEFRMDAGEQLNEQEILNDWDDAAMTPAAANHQIYLVTDSCFLIPGPRSPEAADKLFELIHAK